MALYSELYNLLAHSELRNRIAVAVGVAAETIRNEDPLTENHVNRLVWAVQAFSRPVETAQQVLWAVVVANRDHTVEQIIGVGDTAIQTNVDAVVDVFATGG